MSIQPPRRSRPMIGRRLVVASLLAGLAWGLLTSAGIMAPIERVTYDLRLRLHPKPPLPGLVVVAIDEYSLNFLGAWPWPRTDLARLIDALGQAKGVLWDVVISDPSTPKRDQALAEALRRHGRVYLGVATGPEGKAVLPDPLFLKAARGKLGGVQFLSDEDGITRGRGSYLQDAQGNETLLTINAAFAQAIRPSLHFPHDRLYFHYQGGSTTGEGTYFYPQYAAQDVLLGLVPPEEFAGKYVLVGATAEGLNDRVFTPYGPISGIHYHAQATASLVRNDWRTAPNPWIGIGLAAFTGALAILLWQVLPTTSALAGLLAYLSVIGLLDLLAWLKFKSWMPLGTVLTVGTATVIVLGIGHQLNLTIQLRRAIEQLLTAFRQQNRRYSEETFDAQATRRLPLQEQVAALLAITDAYRQESQFLQTLIETNPNPVLVCDEDRLVFLVNQAGVKVFGANTLNSHLMRVLEANLPEEQAQDCEKAFTSAIYSGDSATSAMIQWNAQAFRLQFLKLAVGRGTLCLFEDVTALHRRANTDGLTGLWNRRYFDEQLRSELARFQRYGDHIVSLVMIDIDHFKSVNDRFGHQVGDQVLILVAGLLQQLVRTTDWAVRYGGEEMGLLLPHTPLEGAQILAERVRQEVEALKPTDSQGNPFQVTASFGVSACRPTDAPEDLLARADHALYESKENGRNQVTLAPNPD